MCPSSRPPLRRDTALPAWVPCQKPRFFSSGRRHTRLQGDWEFRRVLFRSKVIAESERVLPSDPEDGMLSADLTEGHLKLGLILSREGSPQAMEQINLALNQNQRYREAHPDQVLVKLRSARCLGGRALAAYRLASRPGVSSTERNQQLTQAREDITQADQIVAALPPQ